MDKCAACGQICLGHEENSVNHMILVAHASQDHSSCHPDGCSMVGRSFHAHVCTNCGGDAPCVGTRTASVCDTFDGFCKTCFVQLSRSEYILKSADAEKLNEYRRRKNTGQPPVTDAEADLAMTDGSSLQRVRGIAGPHRPEAATSEETFQRGIMRRGPKGEPSELTQQLQNVYDKAKGFSVQLMKELADDLAGSKGKHQVTDRPAGLLRDISTEDGKHSGEPMGFQRLFGSTQDELPEWIVEAKLQIEDDFKLASNECGTCGHGWSKHGNDQSCSCCANFKKGSKEESSDSHVPPASVASNAKRGLELRKKYNRGGTEVGVARARDLSNRKGLSYSTVKRMKAYFDRHEVDKKGEGWGKDSAGYIAWLLWGGDAGRSWANKIVKSKEKKSSIQVEADGKVIDFNSFKNDKVVKEINPKPSKPKMLDGYFEGEDPLFDSESAFTTEWPEAPSQPRRLTDRLRDAWRSFESHELGIAHYHYDDLEKEVEEQAETPLPEISTSQVTPRSEEERGILDSLKQQVEEIRRRAEAMEELAKQSPTVDDLIESIIINPLRMQSEMYKQRRHDNGDHTYCDGKPCQQQPETTPETGETDK